MPVLLVKAALTSSSAFFSEAAAKTVMVFSCASAGEGGVAVPTASATAARKAIMRLSILALLEDCGAAARYRAALRQQVVGTRPIRKRRSGPTARLRRAARRSATLAVL